MIDPLNFCDKLNKQFENKWGKGLLESIRVKVTWQERMYLEELVKHYEKKEKHLLEWIKEASDHDY